MNTWWRKMSIQLDLCNRAEIAIYAWQMAVQNCLWISNMSIKRLFYIMRYEKMANKSILIQLQPSHYRDRCWQDLWHHFAFLGNKSWIYITASVFFMQLINCKKMRFTSVLYSSQIATCLFSAVNCWKMSLIQNHECSGVWWCPR